MKITMFMLVAGAAIAFAAPMANAHEVSSHHAPVVHTLVKAKKVIKSTTGGKATAKKVATSRPPLYIYSPGYSGPPIALTPDQIDWCETSMVNCTDQTASDPTQSSGPADTSPDAQQQQQPSPQLTAAVTSDQSASGASMASDTTAAAIDGSSDDC